MLKISTKLTLWYLSATAVIIFIIALAMYYIFDVQRREAIDDDLVDYADFLISGLGSQTSELESVYDEIMQVKKKPPIKPRAHRFALASNDSVIYEPSALQNLSSLIEELEDKKEFSFKSDFNTLELNDMKYRTYTKNIKIRTGKEFQLIVFTPLDKLYESLAQLRFSLFVILPFSLIAAGLIGLIIGRRALSPVRTITETASTITSDSLDKRVPIRKTNDELSKLSETFNNMINRLDNTFKSQQRFIADVSHDIRTPLTVMQLELDLLSSDENLYPDSKEAVERCQKELFRLNRLTDNLLILARADSDQLKLDKKNLRLDELVLNSLSQLKHLADRKKIKLIVNISEPIEIIADESYLERVIINILDNALKYSPEEEEVNISVFKENKFAVVSVNNKGNPISDSKHEEIFKRFIRGDRSRTSKGFGLGLAIVKALVDAHSGNVTLQSDEKTGTSVKIFLP